MDYRDQLLIIMVTAVLSGLWWWRRGYNAGCRETDAKRDKEAAKDTELLKRQNTMLDDCLQLIEDRDAAIGICRILLKRHGLDPFPDKPIKGYAEPLEPTDDDWSN